MTTSAHPTILIVGGVAAGASAATRARRMNENAEIILLEKDEYVSFANCGLPYYIGGEIAARKKLLVATSKLLHQRFRIDVRTRNEAMEIDREGKTATVADRASGGSYEQHYDKLILATGASPAAPPIEGASAPNVFTLRNMEDADRIKAAAGASRSQKAVVVGAGFIGLEIVEQLVRCGFQTSLAELLPQVLPAMDPEMAQPLEAELRRHGVDVRLGDGLQRILVNGEGLAAGVELAGGARLEGELVILGLGVRPNVELARRAGLQLGPHGGIAVNSFMQTSDPDIYAAGDAVEYRFGPTGEPLRVPLAGPANRAGRLAGQHAATGGSPTMAPVFGTAAVRLFGQAAAVTGLTIQSARRLGRPIRSVTIVADQHAGYFPGAAPLTLKLCYEPETGKVLGAQAVGPHGVDKRIDVAATAMALGANVRDLAGLDLAYAPPFGSAKDPIHLAAFAACNQLDGIEDFVDCDADLRGKQVVDVRTASEVATLPLAGADSAVNIPLDQLRGRLDQLDRRAETVVSCAVGLRAHVAARILRQHGFERVANLAGGAIVRARALARR